MSIWLLPSDDQAHALTGYDFVVDIAIKLSAASVLLRALCVMKHYSSASISTPDLAVAGLDAELPLSKCRIRYRAEAREPR